MVRKVGIVLAILVLASALTVPIVDAEKDDVFSYRAQLDDCGKTVFDKVQNTVIDENTVVIEVSFDENGLNLPLFSDESSAKAYANQMVQNALAAEYYSNPMMAYLWNYPVKEAVVEPEIKIVKIVDGEKSSNYYEVASVKFNLSLPDGLDKNAVTAVNNAVKEISIGGSKSADKVKSIIDYLNGISKVKDEDGKVSNIYNALVEKKTSSAGIAAAFNRLCNENGIVSIALSGTFFMCEEKKSYWNYVYIEEAWYIVDAAFCANAKIAGHCTYINDNNNIYTMTSEHCTDLTLSSGNTLNIPVLKKDAYNFPSSESILEKYGGMIVMISIGIVVILTLAYAFKKGQL